jgi:hypothetical protein
MEVRNSCRQLQQTREITKIFGRWKSGKATYNSVTDGRSLQDQGFYRSTDEVSEEIFQIWYPMNSFGAATVSKYVTCAHLCGRRTRGLKTMCSSNCPVGGSRFPRLCMRSRERCCANQHPPAPPGCSITGRTKGYSPLSVKLNCDSVNSQWNRIVAF